MRALSPGVEADGDRSRDYERLALRKRHLVGMSPVRATTAARPARSAPVAAIATSAGVPMRPGWVAAGEPSESKCIRAGPAGCGDRERYGILRPDDPPDPRRGQLHRPRGAARDPRVAPGGGGGGCLRRPGGTARGRRRAEPRRRDDRHPHAPDQYRRGHSGRGPATRLPSARGRGRAEPVHGRRVRAGAPRLGLRRPCVPAEGAGERPAAADRRHRGGGRRRDR